jgi:hypothetical protein
LKITNLQSLMASFIILIQNKKLTLGSYLTSAWSYSSLKAQLEIQIFNGL